MSRTRVSVIVLVTERPHDLAWLYASYSRPFVERGRPFEFVFAVEPRGPLPTEALESLIDSGEPVRIVTVGQAVGESALLDAAASTCTSAILVTLPAYPRVDPEALEVLVSLVEDGADMASAARVGSGVSLLNRVQSRAFHFLLNRAVGGRFRDVASGVCAMRRSVLSEVPLYGDLFRFLPLLADREGFDVVEREVSAHPQDRRTRIYGPSVYLRRLVDLLGLLFLVRFTHKPLRFFGLIGAPLSLVGGSILVVLLLQRLGGRSLADRPMLLLGTLCFVLGVQAIAMGLIGEIIVHWSSTKRAYRLREDPPPIPAGEEPATLVD